MSVNTAHANGGVLIHTGETILLFSDNVLMEFHGQDGALFKKTKEGRIYLTTHRVIFNNKNPKDPMQSFSSPFVSMNDVELEQPVFGANYIKGKIRAQENGNWTGETKFKVLFKSGGCIDFGQALLRAASMAQRNAGNMPPPAYTPPSNDWYAAPPPAYTPNPGAYGWLPQNSAFGAPTNGVFMTDNPPPYPGINPNYTPGYPAPNGFGQQQPMGYAGPQTPQMGYTGPQPPQMGFAGGPGQQPPQQMGFAGAPSGPSPSYPSLPQNGFGFGPSAPSAPGQNSKEAEAAQSAYYDPRVPNAAFVQQTQFYENPPPYSAVDQTNKKQQ